MKVLLLACSLIASLCTKAQSVPTELLTNDTTYWTISTVSTVGYVNTTPGANYNTYKSGGGMIAKFKFTKNNRYRFQLYIQATTYNITNETWTDVEGTVAFTKNAKGQPIFITRAEKGVYRINKNGKITNRAITPDELKNQHTTTYLWEKSTIKDDPKSVYLLVVDLKQHPNADPDDAKTIDPSWISKFHIPAGK